MIRLGAALLVVAEAVVGTPAVRAVAVDIGGGVLVTERQLDELATSRLLRVRAEEYQIRRRVLDTRLGEILMQREASARHTTEALLLRQEVEERVVEPTSEEAHAVLTAARAQFSGVRDEAALATIADGMRKQRAEARRREFLRELRSKWGVSILLQPPRVDVGATGYSRSRGLPTAPVTIVEYADFQCPFCVRIHDALDKLLRTYPKEVRLVFRDFPLPIHKDAVHAAIAGRCADQQGSFWPMHERLLRNPTALGLQELLGYAKETGLEPSAFEACMQSEREAQALRSSVKEAEALGITSTPTLFFNGRPVLGAAPFEALDDILREELESLQSTPTRAGEGRESR